LNNGACTGNSFPLNPCRKDILGGLFYWLSQHKVARGGQPWFYYSFLFGLYEQVTLVFGLAGIIYFLRRPTLFTTFLTFWAVSMFGIYSWAGEKFPWLLVHPLLPFTLLAGMFIARLFTLSRPVLVGGLVILAALAVVEIHSMYEVNFVNGADPVEMMVYVQSAPDTPLVARQIETLSYKDTNDLSMPVTVDTNETWPFAWYLRHMTAVAYPSASQLTQKPYSTNPVIIADTSDVGTLDSMLRGKYTRTKEILRWWFPEDYKTLSWGAFAHDAVSPGYWSVIWQWLTQRRPFGPKGTVTFYYYVKHGIASPF
jgi:predicted membrane-bound mannosyltransferase